MPKVYGNRQIGLAPLPGVRKQAAKTALSEGAGVAQAEGNIGAAIEQLGGVGQQIAAHVGELAMTQAKEARDRADQTAMLDASNQLTAWTNQRLYDPNEGALAKKGKDAMNLPEDVLDDYNKKADEVAAGLSTDKQREAFVKMRLDQQQSLDLTVRRHTLGEMQNYESGELKAYVENSTNSAIQNALDPNRINVELTNAVGAIKTQGPRLGMGPIEIAGAVQKAQNAVHVGVIDKLLALDKTKAASIYFEETKGEIDGDMQTKIVKALDDAGTRSDAQKQSDAIVAAGGTLTEQREKARQIDDPKLRDQVMERIEHEAAVKDKIDRDTEENRLMGAYNIIDRTHDVAKIPTNVWTQLTGNSRTALRSYAEHLAKGVPVETDLPTYYGLMKSAADNPEKFATSNLLEYRAKLGDTEFKQLAGLQLSIRSADSRKTEKELSGYLTNRQVVENTLSLYGIDSNAKGNTDEGKAIAQLQRMIDNRVGAFQNLTGKQPTNDDVQRITDELLSQNVTVPGSWWNIWPGGKPFFDQSKRIIDFKVGDIPAADRTLIEQALRKAGRPVSDATVLDLYIETHARKGK
jgi:hypothetical protein